MNSLKHIWKKFGTNHELSNVSKLSTYPIPRLEDNYKFIEKTYNLLNQHIKLNIDIYPARRMASGQPIYNRRNGPHSK